AEKPWPVSPPHTIDSAAEPSLIVSAARIRLPYGLILIIVVPRVVAEIKPYARTRPTASARYAAAPSRQCWPEELIARGLLLVRRPLAGLFFVDRSHDSLAILPL